MSLLRLKLSFFQFDNSAELVIDNTLRNIDEDGAAGESEHHRFWGIKLFRKSFRFFLYFRLKSINAPIELLFVPLERPIIFL